MSKPYVTNAADKEQVNEAKKKEGFRRKQELNDLRGVLSTKEGRRFLYKMLAFCGTFRSTLELSAKIYYNAGKQDVGHYLMAEIIEADKDAYLLMIKEAEEANEDDKKPDLQKTEDLWQMK